MSEDKLEREHITNEQKTQINTEVNKMPWTAVLGDLSNSNYFWWRLGAVSKLTKTAFSSAPEIAWNLLALCSISFQWLTVSSIFEQWRWIPKLQYGRKNYCQRRPSHDFHKTTMFFGLSENSFDLQLCCWLRERGFNFSGHLKYQSFNKFSKSDSSANKKASGSLRSQSRCESFFPVSKHFRTGVD